MVYLELQGISKKYSEQFRLDNIHLKVKAGEIVGLLGESGAGKSTLLRIAAGLIDADSGTVKIKGKTMPPASSQLIAGYANTKMVAQDFQLSAPLTVQENIAYALRFYKKEYQQQRVAELIALCHLESVANQPVKVISGGEKQRTAIAQALAEEVKILLLDEPFAHLDSINKRRLSEAISNIVNKLRVACIFVTHDAPDALRLSHRMGIIKAGKLIQVDTPQNVYRYPTDTYVAHLTGEANLITKSFYEKYLKHKLVHKIDAKWVMLRPEQLRLVEGSGIEVEVKRVVFEGMHYKIYAKKDQQSLLFYHREAIPTGVIIMVN